MALRISPHEFAQTNFARAYLFHVEGANIPSPYASGGTFPYVTFEAFTHHSGNSLSYHPGQNDVDDVEIEFYETEDNAVYNFFLDWQNQVFSDDNDGTYNMDDEFKRRFKVVRLDGTHTGVWGLEYTGVWPKKISDYEPSWENNSEVLKFSVTLSVDNVERIVLHDVEGSRSRKIQQQQSKYPIFDQPFAATPSETDGLSLQAARKKQEQVIKTKYGFGSRIRSKVTDPVDLSNVILNRIGINI